MSKMQARMGGKLMVVVLVSKRVNSHWAKETYLGLGAIVRARVGLTWSWESSPEVEESRCRRLSNAQTPTLPRLTPPVQPIKGLTIHHHRVGMRAGIRVQLL